MANRCPDGSHADVRGGVCRSCGAFASELQPLPCAACGSTPAVIREHVGHWVVSCSSCGGDGVRSAVGLGLDRAVGMWNVEQVEATVKTREEPT